MKRVLVSVLAKHVIRPAAGPQGMTVRAPDADTIRAYVAADDGFATFVDEGRAWVFRKSSDDLATYLEKEEPAKFVIRPGAGSPGATVKSADAETIDADPRVAAPPVS